MELILFLIVGGIFWFINYKFGDQVEPPQGPTQPRRSQAPGQPYQQPRADPTQHMSQDERTRRIQEEIRRKIAARRGQSTPQSGMPAPQQPLPWEEQPTQYPHQQQPGYPRQQEQPQYPQQPQPTYPRKTLEYGRPGETKRTARDAGGEGYGRPQTSSPYFDAPPPIRDYQAELAEKRRQVEESVRRAAEARKMARTKIESVSHSAPASPRTKSTFSGLSFASSVKARLRSPEAAREAFVHMEILGTPVGQRVNGKIGRSWDS